MVKIRKDMSDKDNLVKVKKVTHKKALKKSIKKMKIQQKFGKYRNTISDITKEKEDQVRYCKYNLGGEVSITSSPVLTPPISSQTLPPPTKNAPPPTTKPPPPPHKKTIKKITACSLLF